MNIASQLLGRALQYPDAPAVTAADRTITFGELAGAMTRLAAGLLDSIGLQPNDRVLVYLENQLEYTEILFAAWAAGACVVPVNAKLHGREVGHIIDDSQARVLFTSRELAEGLGSGSCQPDRTDGPIVVEVDEPGYGGLFGGRSGGIADTMATTPAWIFYTSGTTGFPKGATLSHRNLLAMALAYYADIERVEPGTTMLHAAALSHGSGQYLLPHLLGGGHQVLFRRFDPTELLDAFETYPEVSMFAVPTMVNRLVRTADAGGKGPGRLRSLIYGGAPMYVADLERAMAVFGPRLYQLYGQGETPMTITGLDHRAHRHAFATGDTRRLGTCGRARTGVDVRVVDGSGKDCPLDEPGEIITRSDCVMSGYWNNPEATAAALRGGWLWTGDVGSLDAAGDLTLRDRSKDMLISGGSNIYPREIEEVLLRHPAVLECSVVGKPHQDLGEEPVAFVVVRPGGAVDSNQLDRLCLEHIARFKRPREYRFIDTLPKNSYAKILKAELRKLL